MAPGEGSSSGSFRVVPADLVAVLVATGLLNVSLFAPVVRETWLRYPLVIAFLLFVPGYVVIAALYPDRGSNPAVGGARTDGGDGITTGERIALSIGLSVVVVPFVGLFLANTQWGIRLIPVAAALSAITVALVAVATARRRRLAPADRFRIPYRRWASRLAAAVRPTGRGDAALTGLLVLSVLLAAGSVGYAAAVLPAEDEYTSVQLLTEQEGELVADGYPAELEGDDEVILTVDNSEQRPVTYTVALVEQSIDTDGDELTVEDQQERDRTEVSLDHGEQAFERYELEALSEGEVRFVWVVYLDDVPEELTVESADHVVHVTSENGTAV